jgi:hypothetical protein
MMRSIDELPEYNGRNGEEIFEQLSAQLTGGGQFRLILTKGMSSGYLQNLMFRLGIPGAFDLIMVPPGAMVKPSEQTLQISGKDKQALLLRGVPFVPPYSKSVIAWQVAIAFGVVMPLFSQETPLAPVGLIAINCFMANMIMAPFIDGTRYSMKVYLDKLNAMGASLLLGISMFSFMSERDPIYRAAAVGSVVAACVSFNAHINLIEKIFGSGCFEREACKTIAMTFAGTSVEVFGVVATLHQISEQLGDKSALAIITKMAAAMLIITQRENVCSLACNAIGSLWHNPRQNEGPVDIESRGEDKDHSEVDCSRSQSSVSG